MEPVKLKDGHRPCTAFAPFECCEAAITCQTHLAICIWDLLVGRPGDAHGTNEIPKQDLNWGGEGRAIPLPWLAPQCHPFTAACIFTPSLLLPTFLPISTAYVRSLDATARYADKRWM